MQILNPVPKPTGKATKNRHLFFAVLAAGAVTLFSASCQKDQAVAPALGFQEGLAANPPVGGSAVNFTFDSTYGTVQLSSDSVYQVSNFFQGLQGTTGNPPHQAHSIYYYRFSTTDGADDLAYDLKFSGTANADISVPTGYTLEYTTTAFASVSGSTTWTTISSGKVGLNRISTTNFTVNTSAPGWYNYDITNHVALPLVENGQNLTIRVTKPGTGGYRYVIELQDLYQNRTPNATVTPNNFPFFFFRYKRG